MDAFDLHIQITLMLFFVLLKNDYNKQLII